MSATITLVGRLAADPELRFTPSGKAVASFTVVTDRRKKNGDNWESVDTTFWRCDVWDQQAEHVAESLTKGTLVLVAGQVVQEDYETKEGQKRSLMKVRVDHIGPSLKSGPATVRKAERASQPAHDPWDTTSPAPF